MRLTYSAGLAGITTAIVGLAAMQPAFATPAAVPEPSSVNTLGAGAIVLAVIVFARLIALKRHASKAN